MARKGYFTTRRKGRLSYYFLTPKSIRMIRRAEDRSVKRPAPEPWDGYFRMLSYEIPESRRDERVELGAAFRQAGLGRAAAGLWASARDLPSELRSLIDEPRFRSLVSEYRASLVGDARAFARRVWGLDEKAAALRAFRDRYAPEAARYAELSGEGQSPPPDESFRRCIELVSDFVEVMACQPPLPPELLPEDWPAAAAAELYVGYRRLVSLGANEYTNAVHIPY
jgi:phenylacetic acid degradation operon negative regulatory protein